MVLDGCLIISYHAVLVYYCCQDWSGSTRDYVFEL